MTHESENPYDVPIAIDDRPENPMPKEATDVFPESLSRDELFDILANRRHRYILHCLRTSKTPMALADLADELIRYETGRSPSAAQNKRKRIYVSLYHCELPKLADAGLIAFQLNEKLVALRDDAAKLPLGLVQPSAEDLHKKDSDDHRRK